MERLTFEGNFCDIAQCAETPGVSFCGDGYCSQRRVWERLKAYEDTLLPPDVCAEYKKLEDEAIGKGVTFKHIVELMNADAEGRIIVLLPERLAEHGERRFAGSWRYSGIPCCGRCI